ncbi:putative cell survival pathways protein [Nowakowskiella sp. JEL0078]|nr:putative cell survival pathways protein [Nowakowskiella sp. JEL0078]
MTTIYVGLLNLLMRLKAKLFTSQQRSIISFLPKLVTCRAYGPNLKIHKTASHWASSFKLSDDKLSVACEQISIKKRPGELQFSVSLDFDAELRLNFSFDSIDGGFKVDDGVTYFSDDPTVGYVRAGFIPKASVKGFLLTNGKNISLDGEGMMVRALQLNPQCAARWNFVNFQSEKHAITLYQFELPDGYDYQTELTSVGSLVLNGKVVSVTIDNYSRFTSSEYDYFSGYKIPKEVDIQWKGLTSDGQLVSIHMLFTPTNLCDKIDILSELPYLVRKFVQTFITAPFVYQWFQPGKASVTVGEKKFEIEGDLFFENTFMVELENYEE